MGGGAQTGERNEDLWGADNILFLVLVGSCAVVCLIIIVLSINIDFMHYSVNMSEISYNKEREGKNQDVER